jgi:hypothetical protein
MDSSAFARGKEVLPNGGMAFAHHYGVGCLGSTTAVMAPSWFPRSCQFAGGKAAGSGGPFPLGQQWTRLPALGTAQYCRAPEERLAVSPLLRMTPPRRLLALAPEHVLVGHGEGIHVDAPAALRDAVRLARRRASSWAWAGLRAHARFHRPAR